MNGRSTVTGLGWLRRGVARFTPLTRPRWAAGGLAFVGWRGNNLPFLSWWNSGFREGWCDCLLTVLEQEGRPHSHADVDCVSRCSLVFLLLPVSVWARVSFPCVCQTSKTPVVDGSSKYPPIVQGTLWMTFQTNSCIIHCVKMCNNKTGRFCFHWEKALFMANSSRNIKWNKFTVTSWEKSAVNFTAKNSNKNLQYSIQHCGWPFYYWLLL